ncbi:MAG: DUF2339 domain-containing protein [Gammaproteobacteria bacterium]|nr:DUF2339 domain-containing protein [Gammaproteobacteria bacterium]
MQYLLAVVGAFFGWNYAGLFGFVFGGVLGYIAVILSRQGKDLEQLKQQVASLVAPASAAAPSVPEPPTPESVSAPAPEPTPEPAIDQAQPAPTPSPPPLPTPSPASSPALEPAVAAGPVRSEASRPASAAIGKASQIDKLIAEFFDRIKSFFTTGNVVVRVGVIVLFFGVAFLLNYAYEHSMIPVELRLAGAGLGGIALTVFGWRLRGRSDTYGLVLQGAGVGILYLTIYASARFLELVPLSAAFVLLITLVIASSVLAVVQKSQALAIFAMSGGFLTPVLLSTDTGNHVALFSYYALLNAGILVMAWFQFWRWLNWVGFVFTFVIGTAWGVQNYQPDLFATTEPFLVLFFFFYLGVSMLFARRRDVELRGVVDGTLVFGMPIAAFGLQAAMTQDMEFGLAFSALGGATIYVLLAWWLKRQAAFSALLSQSFVALAVIFATLAIPFAFDNQRFTAASWAIEGAGLLWLGLYQNRRLPRAFGILLQVAGAGAFIAESGSTVAPTLFLNSAFLGAALLSIAAGYTAYLLSTKTEVLYSLEKKLRWLFLPASVFWWSAGGVHELQRFLPSGYGQFDANNVNENLLVLYAAVSAAVFTFLAKRFTWREGLLPGFLLLPVLILIMAGLGSNWENSNAFADFGWLAWPVAILSFGWHLKQVDEYPQLCSAWHAGGWWFLTFFLTWNVASVVNGVLPDSAWTYVLWGVVPLGVAAFLLRARHIVQWPFISFPGSYFVWGWAVMLGYLLSWLLITSGLPGDPDPLPYVVLANPLELAQLAILLVAGVWVRGIVDTDLKRFDQLLKIGLAGVGFVWLNLTAARAVHFYAGIDYPIDRIIETDVFQTTASILWTSLALLLMSFGKRRVMRPVWIVGASLLGLVILKLFVLDLANLETVARIVSFITVGVLMLVIGYFAPIPPSHAEEADT